MANCIILSGGTWSPENWAKIKRSLGPYRLASSLKDAGYTTQVLEYTEELTTEEVLKFLSIHVGEDTLWVGFSSTFYWVKRSESNPNSRLSNAKLDEMYHAPYEEIEKLFAYIREHSNAKLIYGGAKSQFYMIDDNIDYYVVGNADDSIINITNHIAGKEELKHRAVYDDHVIVDSVLYTEPDVKNIPTRWWEYPVLPNEGLPIELARGCIFKCKFCNYQLTGKKKGTYIRDLSQVRDELIKTWETHGTDTFFFTDDTFNDDNDKLDDIHKMLSSLPFKPKFSCYSRVDLIHKFPHQVQQLQEMGLIGTYMGLETIHPESAKAIGKGLHPSKVRDTLYKIKEQWDGKVNIEAGFILGLPYDTLSYFNELLSWTLQEENPIDSIHFFPLMLFQYTKKELQRYQSEFSINPEIYGYKFQQPNSGNWSLPSQKLTYSMCLDIANKFSDLRNPMNKISGFHMITTMNAGVPLEDIYKLTNEEIIAKYDIPAMNAAKIGEYKTLVGL